MKSGACLGLKSPHSPLTVATLEPADLDWLWADFEKSLGRLLADFVPTADWLWANFEPTLDCLRPTSAKIWNDFRPTAGRLWAVFALTVDRLWTDTGLSRLTLGGLWFDFGADFGPPLARI